MSIFLRVKISGGSVVITVVTLSFVEWMDFRLLEKFVMLVVLDFFFSSSAIKLNCL